MIKLKYNDRIKLLSEYIVNYDKSNALKVVYSLLEDKCSYAEIINDAILNGMDIIKDKFEKLDIFLPELILASDIAKEIISILFSKLSDAERKSFTKGRVVIGTPKGDIHDIGKNIFATMLIASGYEVYDIGISKDIDDFINRAKETKADIIAVSCLMTTSLVQLRELIEDMNRLKIRDKYKVIFGGGAVTDSFACEVQADGYSISAGEGVIMVKELLLLKEGS